MTTLELKHLAPYLPYELKAMDEFGKIRIIDWQCQSYKNSIVGLNHIIKNDTVQVNCFKPIFKKLSNLSNDELIPIGLLIRNIETQEATINDKIFAIEDSKTWIRGGMKPVLSLSQTQNIMQYLYSIHADIYGLIETNLGIELKPE